MAAARATATVRGVLAACEREPHGQLTWTRPAWVGHYRALFPDALPDAAVVTKEFIDALPARQRRVGNASIADAAG